MKLLTTFLAPLLFLCLPLRQASGVPRPDRSLYVSLDSLYTYLHRHPELSFQEKKTAAKMAAWLRAEGFEVTDRVGGYGVVGVLRNGKGPTVMVRTDLDALPMREQTGLRYSSAATAVIEGGETVPVMHACGHDMHMTTWAGAAAELARVKDRWRGTLVFIGQPAEERGQGARLMVKDGLFSRFPKPNFVVGIHVTETLPAGKIGMISGPASAASNAVDITFYGKGGHGAIPHKSIDPVLMAARAVVTLQTIVAREVDPFQPAVVTVGTFHAGTKRNIIPDEAKLQLTVRSYASDVQKQLLAAIDRIARAEAAAAGAPREPAVVVDEKEATEVCVNDPGLAARLTTTLRRALGDSNVVAIGPFATAEDFGVYGRVAGVPAIQLRLGVVEPVVFRELAESGQSPPGPHSPKFAPERERSIRTGVAALVASALELLAPTTTGSSQND